MENLIVSNIVSEKDPYLCTDAYKYRMGLCGFPLKEETFYLSFRHPGIYNIPFDIKEVMSRVCSRISESVPAASPEFLTKHNYPMTPAMIAALKATPKIWAAPKGSWVGGGNPIVTITGPSFLVSMLEPIVLKLNFPIQIATAMIKEGVFEFATCSCYQSKLVREMAELLSRQVTITEIDRTNQIRIHFKNLLDSLYDGNPERILEVGCRGLVEWKTSFLSVLASHGLKYTSDVYSAKFLGLTPVGTTGHEHQQRWGGDESAFRALCDMSDRQPGFLPDTYDEQRGLETAMQVAKEYGKPVTFRFDNRNTMLDNFKMLVQKGFGPCTFVFMDGMNPESISKVESARVELGIPASQVLFGVGGYLSCDTMPHPYTRNRVSAVYKLSKSGNMPTMKFSTPEKQSLPGIPVLFQGPFEKRMIGQLGETPPADYSTTLSPLLGRDIPSSTLSPKTQQLIAECKQRCNIKEK
jgi:nicotinic acid phosphoribosyltransferase